MKPVNKAMLIMLLVSALCRGLFGVCILATLAAQTVLFGVLVLVLSFVSALKIKNASPATVERYRARVARFKTKAARQQ